MSNIKASCFTNLDVYALEEWPIRFCYPPREQDRVQAKSGKTLTVVKVTHCIGHDGPYIRVELHR